MCLDVLIDIAHGIASDFVARPHLYVSLGGRNTGALLASLKFKYGFEEFILSPPLRQKIYAPYFGYRLGDAPTPDHDFVRLRDQLNAAAASFAERVFDTGADMLRERVRSAHRPFKEYLTGLEGEALEWSVSTFDNLANQIGYRVFRIGGIAGIYGVTSPPSDAWPYAADANGDKLVEEASRLTSKFEGGPPTITRERFSSIQRIALRGAEALASVLDYDESQNVARLDALITCCYSWGSALKSFEGGQALM